MEDKNTDNKSELAISQSVLGAISLSGQVDQLGREDIVQVGMQAFDDLAEQATKNANVIVATAAANRTKAEAAYREALNKLLSYLEARSVTRTTHAFASVDLSSVMSGWSVLGVKPSKVNTDKAIELLGEYISHFATADRAIRVSKRTLSIMVNTLVPQNSRLLPLFNKSSSAIVGPAVTTELTDELGKFSMLVSAVSSLTQTSDLSVSFMLISQSAFSQGYGYGGEPHVACSFPSSYVDVSDNNEMTVSVPVSVELAARTEDSQFVEAVDAFKALAEADKRKSEAAVLKASTLNEFSRNRRELFERKTRRGITMMSIKQAGVDGDMLLENLKGCLNAGTFWETPGLKEQLGM